MQHAPPAESVVQTRMKRGLSGFMVLGLARAAEFSAMLATGFLVHALRVAELHGLESSYILAIPAMSLGMVLLAQAAGAYTLDALRAPLRTGLRVALCWVGVIFAAMAFAFFLRMEASFSRGWLGVWLITGLVTLLVLRTGFGILARWLTRRGKLDRYAVIVGGGPLAEMLLGALSRQPCPDLRILGLFDDREDERTPDVVAGYPKLGTIDDLLAFARHVRIDQVIFALPITAEGRILVDAAETLGAAGRYQAGGACQSPALPPALLFLHRRRAGVRRARQAACPKAPWPSRPCSTASSAPSCSSRLRRSCWRWRSG